ncbi:MAG: nucleotide exchange factor GrpE [Patescibacteria group bacterium]|nr:nucleotide exchange factor GrpE [Patescibacteria group bacterium]
MSRAKKPLNKCPQCEKLSAELAKMTELAGRAQADLQNAKSRMQKEGEELRKFALENTLLLLLPTIDNFQRAFEHLPADLEGNEWVEGVVAIEKDLMGKLSALGLQKIESIGESVDPEKHEVLQTGPGEEGKVIEVFEVGFMFNGRVLRPAKVMVGAGNEK